jgi:hypothetical protein
LFTCLSIIICCLSAFLFVCVQKTLTNSMCTVTNDRVEP